MIACFGDKGNNGDGDTSIVRMALVNALDSLQL